jgi:hypothetical protein
MRKTEHVSLRLDPKLKRLAEQAAAEDHRSLSSLTSFLLAQHCNKDRTPHVEDNPLPKRVRK